MSITGLGSYRHCSASLLFNLTLNLFDGLQRAARDASFPLRRPEVEQLQFVLEDFTAQAADNAAIHAAHILEKVEVHSSRAKRRVRRRSKSAPSLRQGRQRKIKVVPRRRKRDIQEET
jgi:hypothetical protein